MLTRATLIKLSDEDARILYGREDEGLAASLMERGVEIVLFTRGKFGASVSTRSGFSVSVPATSLAAPIVDTMGAGDATLAGVIAFVLGRGMPDSNEAWGACLKQAMDLAAATCRNAGGALILPTSPWSSQSLPEKTR